MVVDRVVVVVVVVIAEGVGLVLGGCVDLVIKSPPRKTKSFWLKNG